MNTNILDKPILKELGEASIRLARGAGALLMHYKPGTTKVHYKDDMQTNPVTEVDLKIEEYLKEELLREFPNHGIVGEESSNTGNDNADFIWALDPLDGTANFAAGLPFYAVSIGLLYKGIPVVGSMFLPTTSFNNSVYHAQIGNGSFLERTPLSVVSNRLPHPSGLASVPAGYRGSFSLQKGGGMGEVRTMGSIAHEMALVASGVLQYSIFTGSHIWDVASGIVLIREAGGEILEWRSGKWMTFQNFVNNSEKNSKGHYQLFRSRGAPLLVGAPEIINHLASRIRVKTGPLNSLLNKLGVFKPNTHSNH